MTFGSIKTQRVSYDLPDIATNQMDALGEFPPPVQSILRRSIERGKVSRTGDDVPDVDG